ncbi:MAG: aminopeptidase, partial [Clostridia bacterium]|nr:aminopeptidase [Clostridia bacterium]
MKKTLVRKYAKLIAKVGANVKKGQPVLIYISADQHDFAAMLAEECYRLGASYVRIEWSYLPVSKLAYRWQSLARLSEVPVWQEEKYKLMAEEFPCRIHIVSDDPDGLRGVDVDKMQKASRAVSKV